MQIRCTRFLIKQHVLLYVTLALLAPGIVRAQFSYTADDTSITIKKYTGSDEIVKIPEIINELPVVGLGNSVFNFCGGLTGVVIPGGVINIGRSAFDNCSNLTAIAVAPTNPAFSSRDGVLFNKNQTTLIRYSEGRSGGYRIPDSVTQIGSGAFFNCGSLTGVLIPNSVTNIEREAFMSCTNLTGVYFKGNAPLLGENAFMNSDKVTSYYLPKSIGWNATSFGDRPTAVWVTRTNAVLLQKY